VKKQSLKTYFLLLVAWVVGIIAILGGSKLYNMHEGSQFDVAVVPYIKQIVPQISQWDPAKTKALMVPEVAATIPEEHFVEAMAWFSRLGALQSMDEPEFDEVQEAEKTELGAQSIIVYNVDTKYENGDAVINLNLIERNGTLQLYRFNFSSDILTEQ